MAVYNKKKRLVKSIASVAKSKIFLSEVVKHLEEPKEVVKKLGEPKAVANNVTDKAGLDRAYDAADDISVIYNTLYIAGTLVIVMVTSQRCRPCGTVFL